MAANTQISRSAQVKEILRCGEDPVHFINQYIKIQHPRRGLIPFVTYDFQNDCVDAYTKHRFNIVLKSRQLGLSTISAAYAVWLALFMKDKNILVIATKYATAKNFILKVKTMLNHLPKWLLLAQFDITQQAATFSNGSVIKAVPTAPDAGRSEALSLLIIDEAAFIDNFEEIYTGLYPTLSEGGAAIILSTPNGVGGLYHKLWVEGVAKLNSFNTIRLPWTVHPEHDQAWFDKETRNLTPRKVAQEMLCISGNARITTPDGFKIAAEIKSGDLVLTHKGRFRRVVASQSRLVRKEENLYSLSSPGNRKNKFLITGNHPALGYRFWANQVSSLDYVRDNHKDLQQSWIEIDEIAKDRKTTDRIVNVLFPKFAYQEIEKAKLIDVSKLRPSVNLTSDSCRYQNQWGYSKRFITADFNLGKFVGLYLAEGWSSKTNDGISFGFHQNELNTHCKFVKDYIENFGGTTTISYPKDKTQNGLKIWTCNKHIGSLVRLFINGSRAWEKELNLDEVLSCGKEFIKGLLYGHFLGDGCHKHDKKLNVVSTSSKLIYQLRLLNSIFDLYPRIGTCDYLRKSHHHKGWYLEFQAEGLDYLDLLKNGQQYKKQSRTRFLGDCFIGHHSITKIDHNENSNIIVYDIEVEEDHSFVAESAVLHNCEFLASGDTFLPQDTLTAIRHNIKQPIAKKGARLEVWIWKHPRPDGKYVLTSDVARGDAFDFSTFQIYDTATAELVAEYLGKTPPDKLGELIAEFGKEYNNALAVVEQNTFGYFTNQRLLQLGYPKPYYPAMENGNFDYKPKTADEAPGFIQSAKSRQQILPKLEEMLRNEELITYSERFYNQLTTFVWHGNRAQACKGSNDDLVITAAMAAWICSSTAQPAENNSEMIKACLNANAVATRDSSALPIQTTNGFNRYGQDTRQFKNAQSYDQRFHGRINFDWLFR